MPKESDFDTDGFSLNKRVIFSEIHMISVHQTVILYIVGNLGRYSFLRSLPLLPLQAFASVPAVHLHFTEWCFNEFIIQYHRDSLVLISFVI